MDKQFTGQYSTHSFIDRQPIHIGDLVTLSIPRKIQQERMIAFKVFEDYEGYKLKYFSGPMSEGNPNYKQILNGQVYKVIGNEKSGIDEGKLE